MRDSGDGAHRQHGGGVVSRSARSSFRALSSYLRIVSSGASTAARSAFSAASSIVDRDHDSSHDQVLWAGFDKLEAEGVDSRRVLLLAYRSGFQVWDAEEADHVRDLVSKRDGPVSFLQMVPKLVESKKSKDKYAESRPLMVISTDNSSSGNNHQDGFAASNDSISSCDNPGNGAIVPTVLRFYSIKLQSYVHMLKFRSVIYSVRCSSRIVAVSQAVQIHCLDSCTLQREYIILTNPIVCGPGNIGYGPLAVGSRWLAYSGNPIQIVNSGRVSPQHLKPSADSASNGNLVTQYAKVSSKQLALGIVTLGDIGYKKLSRYCSEILPDSYNSLQLVAPGWKSNGTANGHLPDADSSGMVIVRDIVSKSVISQFRAHKCPISALCFDPSGTLLVTASVQGHNINVFKIIPGNSETCNVRESSLHLYRLQRGVTNAVIQDISFSDESNWIMVSTSRGTSHLFAINPTRSIENIQPTDANASAKNNKTVVRWSPNINLQIPNQLSFWNYGPPVTLSVVSRIRSGNNGWIGTVSGAATAATGRMSSLSVAVASSFCYFKGNNGFYTESGSLKTKCHLLVFSPLGCMIQYKLRVSGSHDSILGGLVSDNETVSETDRKVQVEAVQKWAICQKQTQKGREDNMDIYGENGTFDCNRVYSAEGDFPDAEASRGKMSHEEKHHLYISEAELQMHNPQNPIWANPEICFQSMVLGGNRLGDKDMMIGEIEIERIPTRVVETRLKNLVPVFDNLRQPKFQQSRSLPVDSNRQPLHQSTCASRRSSSCSHVSMNNRVDEAAVIHDGAVETRYNSAQMPAKTNNKFVHSNERHETKSELVDVNRSVSNNSSSSNKGPQMQNGFADQDEGCN